MKKKGYPVINIGSASMLVIFIILSLVTFATLSVSSAMSDYNFTRKIADRTTEYYEASGKANEILSELDSVLKSVYLANQETYSSALPSALSQVKNISADFSGSQTVVSFSVPMNDALELVVELILLPPESVENGFYEIITWQEVSVKEWSGDQKLKLIGVE